MQGSVCEKYKNFFNIWARKFRFRKYKNCFLLREYKKSFLLRKYEFFLIFELENSVSGKVRNFFWGVFFQFFWFGIESEAGSFKLDYTYDALKTEDDSKLHITKLYP